MKVTKTLTVTKEDGWIVASMPTVDRDRDRVLPLGIDLSNFQKNPIMFFGHNYTDPAMIIGRAVEMSVSPESFKIRPELRAPVNDGDPMTIIKSLWDSGLLRAASIGFLPKKARPNAEGGVDFEEVELLEVSVVGLPANQDALRLALKALSDEPIAKAVDVAHIEPKAESVIYSVAFPNAETKRGRVLSSANEKELRAAYESIGRVLEKLEQAPADEPQADDEPEQEAARVVVQLDVDKGVDADADVNVDAESEAKAKELQAEQDALLEIVSLLSEANREIGKLRL